MAHAGSRAGCGALALAALIAWAAPAEGTVLVTTDQAQVDAFGAGADVEDFEGLTATSLSSYAPGQAIGATSKLSSREPGRLPTFTSGGGTPSDPVGNPGAPVGIVAPTGAIAGDVESGSQVAAPLVFDPEDATEPFNFGFIEVIFPEPVERVGFWITHGGTVQLDLRDENGLSLTTGDVAASGTKGQFVGISRESADISVAALILTSGDAFTIDDFVSTAAPVPEPAGALLLGAGGLTLAGLRGRRSGG